MLQEEFYDDRGESVLVYDGIPILCATHELFEQ